MSNRFEDRLQMRRVRIEFMNSNSEAVEALLNTILAVINLEKYHIYRKDYPGTSSIQPYTEVVLFIKDVSQNATPAKDGGEG